MSLRRVADAAERAADALDRIPAPKRPASAKEQLVEDLRGNQAPELLDLLRRKL